MATIALGPLEQVGTISGNAPRMLSLPEGASQTFKKGAVLSLGTDGLLVDGGSDATNIAGVAAEDGHNTTGARCLIYVATHDTIFAGNVSTSQTTANAQVGFTYGIVKVGTNYHVDNADLTNRRVCIQELDPRDAVGDTQGRVRFVFIGFHSKLSGTS